MQIDNNIITRLFNSIDTEINILERIAASLGANSSEDLLLQYPAYVDDLYLEPGESFEHTLEIGRRLYYLALDLPEGVTVQIGRDSMPYMYAVDEIGALEFKNGVYFGTFTIKVTNTSTVTQKWNVKALFN